MKKTEVLYLLLGIFVFFYILIRALVVPPYFDEINTFFFYVQKGDFIPFLARTDANNHLVNSFLTFIFYKVFGENFFVIRLASALSIIVLMVYLCKLKKFFESKPINFILYIVLITTTYLTDFFILSRGYGLSIAFLTATLYHLINYNYLNNRKDIYYTLFFSMLALWSNLSFIVPIITTWGLVFIIYINKNRETPLKQSILYFRKPFLVFSPFLLFGILYSFKLKSAGSLYFGSDGGLIDAVFIKLSAEIAGSYFYGKIVLLIFSIIYLFSLILNIVYRQLKNSNLIVQSLFWLTIIGYILMHNILGVKYPQERAALQIYLLFMFALFFAIDNINIKPLKYLFALPTLIITIQFLYLFNFKHIQHWKNQTVPYSFYQHLYTWQQNNNIKPTISGHGLLGKVLDYYDYTNGGKLNCTRDDIPPSKIADFIITNNWNSNITGYDTVLYEKETSVALMQREKLVEWEFVFQKTIKDTIVYGDFYNLAEFSTKELKSKSACFDVKFDAQSKDFPFISFIVCTANNANNEQIHYTNYNLQIAKADIREKNTFHRKLFYDKMHDDTEKVIVYLWFLNNKHGVNISNVNVKIFKAE